MTKYRARIYFKSSFSLQTKYECEMRVSATQKQEDFNKRSCTVVRTWEHFYLETKQEPFRKGFLFESNFRSVMNWYFNGSILTSDLTENRQRNEWWLRNCSELIKVCFKLSQNLSQRTQETRATTSISIIGSLNLYTNLLRWK